MPTKEDEGTGLPEQVLIMPAKGSKKAGGAAKKAPKRKGAGKKTGGRGMTKAEVQKIVVATVKAKFSGKKGH